MKKIIITLLVVVTLTGCATRKNVSVLHSFEPTDEGVVVMAGGQVVPRDAIFLGNVQIGDTGFTITRNCTYKLVIEEAAEIAQRIGGNLIYIVEHRFPDSESTCHRINANIYKVTK